MNSGNQRLSLAPPPAFCARIRSASSNWVEGRSFDLPSTSAFLFYFTPRFFTHSHCIYASSTLLLLLQQSLGALLPPLIQFLSLSCLHPFYSIAHFAACVCLPSLHRFPTTTIHLRPSSEFQSAAHRIEDTLSHSLFSSYKRRVHLYKAL